MVLQFCFCDACWDRRCWIWEALSGSVVAVAAGIGIEHSHVVDLSSCCGHIADGVADGLDWDVLWFVVV